MKKKMMSAVMAAAVTAALLGGCGGKETSGSAEASGAKAEETTAQGSKETKEESKISIQQLLLEKMIRSRNFRGGVDVIRRINSEVTRLMLRQGEIVTLLSHNIFEGMEALEEFSKSGLKWFEEEQKLFDTNLELVKKALLRAGEEDYQSQAMEEIYYLNQELKKAMDRHEKLLSACTDLQVQADEMMLKAKRNRFRRTMDFSDLLKNAMERDDIRLLEVMTAPFGMVTLFMI